MLYSPLPFSPFEFELSTTDTVGSTKNEIRYVEYSLFFLGPNQSELNFGD